MKLTIDRAHRDRTRALFTEILGCATVSPMPDLEVYKLDDGFGIGVYFVDAADALPPDEQLKSAWLEFLVDNVDAAVRALDALGLERHTYVDTAHTYFRAPGGYVFRVAPR
jgi:catechol 2,3-dioxygenase-like lactoylglutathione lyase family enzyme